MGHLAHGIVADAHAGHSGDILRGKLARPLGRRDDLGVVGGEPTTGFVQMQPDVAAGLQGRGIHPALDPFAPLGPHAAADVVACRGLARRRDRQGFVQDAGGAQPLGELVILRPPIRRHAQTEALQGLGVEMLRIRALVAQQCLAQAAHQGRAVGVPPLLQRPDHPLTGNLDDRGAEHTMRQGQALEPAQRHDVPEPAMQVGQRGDLDTHALGDPRTLTRTELQRPAPQNHHPVLVAPRPVRAVERQAFAQHHRRRRTSIDRLRVLQMEGVPKRTQQPLKARRDLSVRLVSQRRAGSVLQVQRDRIALRGREIAAVSRRRDGERRLPPRRTGDGIHSRPLSHCECSPHLAERAVRCASAGSAPSLR